MRRQRGLGMAELLVALAIGMLVTLTAATLLLSAQASYVAHTDAARVDDAGRFALSVLERATRQTGFIDWEGDQAGGAAVGAPAIVGLDAASLSSDSAGIDITRPAAVNGSDVLALRFDGNAPGSGDTAMKNCAGASVPADGPGAGWNIFYVANDGLGEPELRCKYRTGSGWNSDALVRGVDGFQVLYALDNDPVDNAPRRFISAGAVALAPDGWRRVSALKVGLLLRGSQAGPARARRYDLFGASDVDAADSGVRIEEDRLPEASRGLLRRVYTATVFLRNRGGS